jgi:hypothetical protein
MERHARSTVLEGAVVACRHDVDESARVRSYGERPSEGLLGTASTASTARGVLGRDRFGFTARDRSASRFAHRAGEGLAGVRASAPRTAPRTARVYLIPTGTNGGRETDDAPAPEPAPHPPPVHLYTVPRWLRSETSAACEANTN